jgi:uridine kinase
VRLSLLLHLLLEVLKELKVREAVVHPILDETVSKVMAMFTVLPKTVKNDKKNVIIVQN